MRKIIYVQTLNHLPGKKKKKKKSLSTSRCHFYAVTKKAIKIYKEMPTIINGKVMLVKALNRQRILCGPLNKSCNVSPLSAGTFPVSSLAAAH